MEIDKKLKKKEKRKKKKRYISHKKTYGKTCKKRLHRVEFIKFYKNGLSNISADRRNSRNIPN